MFSYEFALDGRLGRITGVQELLLMTRYGFMVGSIGTVN
jgi:hypothetical protein